MKKLSLGNNIILHKHSFQKIIGFLALSLAILSEFMDLVEKIGEKQWKMPILRDNLDFFFHFLALLAIKLFFSSSV